MRIDGMCRDGASVRYYPLERFPQKTLYALEELLERTPRKRG